MRKSAFCICENKGADQLRDNRAADQQHYYLRFYINQTETMNSASLSETLFYHMQKQLKAQISLHICPL